MNVISELINSFQHIVGVWSFKLDEPKRFSFEPPRINILYHTDVFNIFQRPPKDFAWHPSKHDTLKQ